MDIKNSETFITVNKIPILSGQDTISDAIDAMKEKNVRVIVVAGAERWDLWLDEIAEYCVEKGPVTPWLVKLETVIKDVPPSETFETGRDSNEVALLLEKERAVMITGSERLAGIATSDEQALWPPAVFECVQGHLFFPPLPKSCPYDGTTIG